MERLLERFGAPDSDPTELFVALFDEIRPRRTDDPAGARRALQALCHILEKRPELRAAVRTALLDTQRVLRHAELYTSTGILPNTGFVSEIFRRIGHKCLPEVLDPELLRTFLRRVFHRPSDVGWVTGVGDDAWLALIDALRFDEVDASPTQPRALDEILRALHVISYWIAAFGMEPELLRLEPALETHASPFVAQNTELVAYLEAYAVSWRQPDAPRIDDKHLRVLFDQCREVIARVRKRAARDGTSIRLTYHLQRLQQLLRRSEHLLDISEKVRDDPDGRSAYPAIVTLFTRLVRDECQRNALRHHWRQNIELLALRVTDNASAHGEHYITETRGEYRQLARAATIGGVVIAFMACFKLLLTKTHMPPLTGALVFCLNYGLGFCLIHILHGSVATKQSAMTANTIAASISETGGTLRDIEQLIGLVARTLRSQLVAILGNVGVAVPLAALIAYGVAWVTGEPFVAPEKAVHLLDEQSLVASGAVFYAAIAGVYLFLAGLISGYYDNYAAYNRVPERIAQLRWTRRVFGEARMRRVAAYVGENLGALASNLAFGFLLGGTTILGVLSGVPLDIRHVAFSSAFVGVALVGTGFSPDPWLLLWALLGVAAIGSINLAVSFALALKVALRARRVNAPPWRTIAQTLLHHLRHHPRDFLLPPRQDGD